MARDISVRRGRERMRKEGMKLELQIGGNLALVEGAGGMLGFISAWLWSKIPSWVLEKGISPTAKASKPCATRRGGIK